MQINNYFNWARFSRLFKQDLLINKTKYFLAILVVGLIAYVFSYYRLNLAQDMILKYHEDPKKYEYYNVIRFYSELFGYYLIVIGVVVGTGFPDLSNKNKAITYMLTPGSTFEKGLLQFVIRIGFFVPIALGIFWIAIRLAKLSLTANTTGIAAGIDPAIIPYFKFRDLVTDYWDHNKIWDMGRILIFVFGLFSYGAYLFAGATYFKRFALIKTVLLSGFIFGIGVLFSRLLSYIFYSSLDVATQSMNFCITKNVSIIGLFITLLSLFSWVFLFAIAYFKLKEKEV